MRSKEIFIPLAFSMFFALVSSSCIMVKKDNGKHKGWTKNTNNPHNPASTSPAKGKGKK